MERPEFEIAKHTVHLIYNQALFWLGLLFTPVLGAMIVIKFLIMWYFTTVVEIKFSKPSTKFWRATNTHTWFLVITFVTALLIMAVLGCIMALYVNQILNISANNISFLGVLGYMRRIVGRLEVRWKKGSIFTIF